MKTVEITGLRNCARCGEDHDQLLFKEFQRPTFLRDEDGDGPYTHWCSCPTTGEPILMITTLESK